MLLKIMPAFFAVISLTLPAGIVVYFLVSNLYRIGQQSYITRAFYREDHKHDAEAKAIPAAESPAKPKPEPKGGAAKAVPPAKEAPARPLPKGQQPPSKASGNGSGQTTRPKPKSSGATARPAPRPVSGGAERQQVAARVDRARRRRTRTRRSAEQCSGSRPPARRWRKHWTRRSIVSESVKTTPSGWCSKSRGPACSAASEVRPG